MKKYFVFILLICIVCFLPSCYKKKAELVKIGIILPLTGSYSPFGDAQKKGYDLAIEEIKNKCDSDKRKYEFVFNDDESNEQKALLSVKKLVTKERVVSIIGTYSSSCTLSAIEIANHSKIPMISPSAAADLITMKGFNWVFRLNAPSSIYAKTIMDFISSLKGIKKVAVLYENSLFGTTTSEYLQKYSKNKNIEVTFSASYDPKDMKLISIVLSNLKKKNPDGIIMISYIEDAINLLKQCKEKEINPKIYIGAGAGFSLKKFVDILGEDANNIFSVSQWSPQINTPLNKEFVKSFKEKYNEIPTFHSVEAYVSAKILAEAIKNIKIDKRPKMIEKDDIRKSLLDLDIQTAYSRVKFECFDGFTNQNKHDMIINQIQKREFFIVWPEKIKAAEIIYPGKYWESMKK